MFWTHVIDHSFRRSTPVLSSSVALLWFLLPSLGEVAPGLKNSIFHLHSFREPRAASGCFIQQQSSGESFPFSRMYCLSSYFMLRLLLNVSFFTTNKNTRSSCYTVRKLGHTEHKKVGQAVEPVYVFAFVLWQSLVLFFQWQDHSLATINLCFSNILWLDYSFPLLSSP